MKMIERVRLIEEIGAADGRRGVAKWVRWTCTGFAPVTYLIMDLYLFCAGYLSD